MLNSTVMRGLLAGFALAFGSITATQAAPLDLSYSTTGDTGQSGVGAVTNTTAPNSYTYGNTFGNLTTTLYTPVSGPSAGINFEFYDDFVFTITGATVNSVSSTVNLGNILAINNLQARLYNASGNPSLPVLGTPVGGAIDAWSSSYSSGSSNITVAVLNDTPLSAGTYVLELRGSVSGSAGGSYSGVLNVAPVPVPAAAWLMGSALLGLVGARRRR